MDINTSKPTLNPYIAGVFLGLILLASYLTLGAGLGASAGVARIGAFCEAAFAPAHVAASKYFGSWGENPLYYYLVFMFVGVFFGGLTSALWSGRFSLTVERGKKAPLRLRLWFAFGGGILVGFASRLANGCTSGQGLSGSALLLSGSMAFLMSVFIGGYAAAWFVRRQWDD